MLEMLTPIHVIFYAFATVAVVSALVVITARNPVRSVLSLVVTFFSMAGVWMLLHAEFLSLILILVYVGAVMTLFLFVVMMLNIHLAKQKSFVNYLPFGILIVLLLTGLILLAISPKDLNLPDMIPPVTANNVSNTAALGQVLYTIYAYPFEIAGVILLAAIIAAITLTHRKPRSKRQDISAQIQVKPEDRLRIIKMPASKSGESS